MNGIWRTMIAALVLLATPAWSVEVGDPLPAFALRTFGGEPVSRATLAGKPALLVFWNTWCAECRRELPEINGIAETFGPRGLAVLAINTGINDSERKAREYWQKSRYGFPAGYDAGFEVAQAFGVRGVPTVFLVDTRSIVRYRQAGLPENMPDWFRQLAATGARDAAPPPTR